jgi:hypothetical protein
VPVITELAAGFAFEPVTFSVDVEKARSYREAVGDKLSFYDETGLVPPLAVAAIALGELLKSVSLPDGTLHVNESLSFRAAVQAGAMLECRAVLAQRSQRAGWIVSVLDSDILLDGRSALTARATVLSRQS